MDGIEAQGPGSEEEALDASALAGCSLHSADLAERLHESEVPDPFDCKRPGMQLPVRLLDR